MRRITPLAATLAWATASLVSAPALAQDGDAPMPDEAREPHAFETAEELLDALETADAGIDRLSAGVRYTKVFAIAGDAQQRRGSLRFQLMPRKMFAIEFRTLQVGGEVHDVEQTFVFDGQWFTEVYPGEKLMIHRRVVAEGDVMDPFDLERGPFPLPLGQRKDVILERFDARLAPPDEGLVFPDEPDFEDLSEMFGGLARRAAERGLIQLALTPRADAGATARDFDTLRMWYDPATLMPAMGMTVKAIDEGRPDIKLLEFFQVRTNLEAAEGEFFVENPGEGWDVIFKDEVAP